MRFVFLFLPLFYSCVTTQPSEKVEGIVTTSGETTAEPIDSATAVVKDPGTGLFCKDDIYSSYLKSEYIKKNSFSKFFCISKLFGGIPSLQKFKFVGILILLILKLLSEYEMVLLKGE